VAIHAFAQAGFPLFGEETRLVILRDEIVEVVICLKNDIAAAAAIAAAGTAFGP